MFGYGLLDYLSKLFLRPATVFKKKRSYLHQGNDRKHPTDLYRDIRIQFTEVIFTYLAYSWNGPDKCQEENGLFGPSVSKAAKYS